MLSLLSANALHMWTPAQICLPRSLWWRHISGLPLFRIIPLGSVFMEAFPFSCAAPGLLSLLGLQPFSLGDLCSLMRWVWVLAEKRPSLWVSQLQSVQEDSTHTEKSHAATSGWFLMGQKSGKWAGRSFLRSPVMVQHCLTTFHCLVSYLHCIFENLPSARETSVGRKVHPCHTCF